VTCGGTRPTRAHRWVLQKWNTEKGPSPRFGTESASKPSQEEIDAARPFRRLLVDRDVHILAQQNHYARIRRVRLGLSLKRRMTNKVKDGFDMPSSVAQLMGAAGAAPAGLICGGATEMSHAIIRGKNGRRHQVDFGDSPVRVEIYASEETVEIFVEADSSLRH